MNYKIKLKNIYREYQGMAHDIYMLWLHEPCKDIKAIKKFLYDYFKKNNINVHMGVDYITPCNNFTGYEFYIIKD